MHHDATPKLPSGTLPHDGPPDSVELRESMVRRREFLKVTGLAMLATVAAGCTGKARLTVPPAKQPADHKPGIAYWFANTCAGCTAGCGALYKTRDGRPIKAEGNTLHPLSQGGLCARGQAHHLSLYDPDRLRGPRISGQDARWSAIDDSVRGVLAAAPEGSIRMLTGSVHGPATLAAISTLVSAYPGAKHVQYDPVSLSGMAEAHGRTHGIAAIPHIRLGEASVIVNFGADFLGTWLSPVEFAREWASRRDPAGPRPMSRLIQIEAAMSLTGAKADRRIVHAESRRGAALTALARMIAQRLGQERQYAIDAAHGLPAGELERIADELLAAKGESLVLCGGNDVAQHTVANDLNAMLGNHGRTLDLANHSQQKLGNDREMHALVADMAAGRVSTVIMWGVNPAYDWKHPEQFAAALKSVSTTISLADRADETASLCTIIAPAHHPLEAWHDGEPVKGLFTLSQPVIRPLYSTRDAATSFLTWAGDTENASRPWRAVMRDHWRKSVLAGATWEQIVENGVLDRRGSANAPEFNPNGIDYSAAKPGEVGDGAATFEIVTPESIALGDGRHANNAWLQEMPEPLTKQTWGNAALLSPAAMRKLGLRDGDGVRVTATNGDKNQTIELPAANQPGQDDHTVCVALGYGRDKAGRVAAVYGGKIGASAFGMGGRPGTALVKIERLGKKLPFARTQEHDSQEGRPIAAMASLDAWRSDPSAGTPHPTPTPSMWPEHAKGAHQWGMVVNLAACIGCSGCIVSCNAENNIPVVGRDEVAMRREMHWLRIDRYYSDDKPGDLGAVADNPNVHLQPMMCQHCENAPCETVCPVAATTRSEEGLNQQTYNRCVGTRYCANNCPYKVRRFNWFDYARNDPTLNLVLNPDVTIRSRGIMEKCSMCVQRIYDAKLAAAKEGRTPKPQEMTTACQQSCPTNAITFGDLANSDGPIAILRKDKRNYAVLAELNVRPGVTYLSDIRNPGGTQARPAQEAAHS